MTLKSHPNKSLETHVNEVREAAHRIWNQHSVKLRGQATDVFIWLEWAVTMHDVGKGSAAFQQYIRNVKRFRGDRRRKAHTPMSLVTSLGFGKAHQWSWKQTLAVGVSAAGHHSGFKTQEELENLLRSYDWQDILVDQLEGFDWQALSEAVSTAEALDKISAPFSTDDDIDELAEWLQDLIEESLHTLSLDLAILYRMQCQLVHSILLEADKAFLIISPEERRKFRDGPRCKIPPAIVDRFIADSTKESGLNQLRNNVRKTFERSIANGFFSSIQTMSLPTGAGKTLLAATWALRLREELSNVDHTPPIIIVLPFLSIIEQTQAIYRQLLNDEGILLSYHSLAIRDHQDSEDPDTAEFFLDTWHGDVVITTFDQFLFALLERRARHQTRFHQLCDALIIMDEIQALPCELWDIVSHVISTLTEIGNCRLLVMSATQTGFLPDAVELIEDAQSIFLCLDRYEILLRHLEILSFDDFISEVLGRAENWDNERVLIVMNTRNSARALRDELANAGHEVFFITADVTPRDRLTTIEKIKSGEPCLVVATQCIEAGVDIDMSLVLRDFSPLDSLIQVAGRCNRNADRPRETIEFFRLQSESGRQFCRIYDDVLLQETGAVLNAYAKKNQTDRIVEGHVFNLSREYFQRLKDVKNLGANHTENFARWQPMTPIRELLRGVQGKQESFVIIEEDPELRTALVLTNSIADPWERRREFRKLASRIAEVTVSVYTQVGFRPERFADRDPTDNFWLLRPRLYSAERGIDLSESTFTDEDGDSWGSIL